MEASEGLAATRARRSNAGSRLKHLIELEEAASGVQQTFLTEEDEDVNLLFQEDENDAEFEEEESGDEEGEEEEGSDEGEAEDAVDDPQKEAAQLQEDEKSDVEVNSDEMLSDSDLSVSENDDSEGERELQKELKAKKRKKKQSIIPAIKKRATEAPKPKKKPQTLSNALLYGERRSSLRKSAVKNKEVLLEKLKADETRRAALTPIVRIKEREPTQEERLAQAQLTEKENILSLNAFLEQEIVKKERQKMMFQQKRAKLRDVVRLVSRACFVTPLEEIEDARHVQDMFEKKRRGRRRKNMIDEPEVRRPGDIDTELPYYRREMAEKQRLEAIRQEEKRKLEEARAERRKKIEQEREERRQKLEKEREERRKLKEARLKEFENIDATDPNFDAEALRLKGEISSLEEQEREEEKNSKLEEEAENAHEEETSKADQDAPKETEEAPEETEKLEAVNDLKNDEKVESEKEDGESKGEDANPEKQIEATPVGGSEGASERSAEANSNENDDSKKNGIQENEDGKAVDVEMSTEDTQQETEREGSESVKVEKKVTFSEEAKDPESTEPPTPVKKEQDSETAPKAEDVEDSKRSVTPVYKARADGQVFEGPVQYVSRNWVCLLDFDDDDRYWKLPETKIKIALFGEESVLSASRRFRDVKTILRSTTRDENPYAKPKDDKEDELFQPVADITEDSPMFDDLKKLRRLGVRYEDEEEEEEEAKEEENVVHIQTEAPTGLYLPNGNKKICLISGKEVRYFDPGTGVPYDSVDDYKVIKTIEAGTIPWYSIPRDQNTYGAVEIYLNNREGTRHAKGVPEGFDGW